MAETTIEEFTDAYMTWVTDVRRARPTTLQTYASTLRAFTDWCAATDVDDLRKIDADGLVAFLNRGRLSSGLRPPSAATVKRERSTLQQFWIWCLRSGLTSTDPFWLIPRLESPRYDPKPIPDELWTHVWKSNLSMDDRLWLGLGYWCGFRRYEMATIAPTSVDSLAGVFRFERKGAHVVALEYKDLIRTVQKFLPHLAVGAEQWIDLLDTTVKLRFDCQWLSPTSNGRMPHDVDAYNHALRALLKAAGLAPSAFTPHQLRHSCATNLHRCGVPLEIIADQLNHTNLTTTRRYVRTSGQLARWREKRELGV